MPPRSPLLLKKSTLAIALAATLWGCGTESPTPGTPADVPTETIPVVKSISDLRRETNGLRSKLSELRPSEKESADAYIAWGESGAEMGKSLQETAEEMTENPGISTKDWRIAQECSKEIQDIIKRHLWKATEAMFFMAKKEILNGSDIETVRPLLEKMVTFDKKHEIKSSSLPFFETAITTEPDLLNVIRWEHVLGDLDAHASNVIQPSRKLFDEESNTDLRQFAELMTRAVRLKQLRESYSDLKFLERMDQGIERCAPLKLKKEDQEKLVQVASEMSDIIQTVKAWKTNGLPKENALESITALVSKLDAIEEERIKYRHPDMTQAINGQFVFIEIGKAMAKQYNPDLGITAEWIKAGNSIVAENFLERLSFADFQSVLGEPTTKAPDAWVWREFIVSSDSYKAMSDLWLWMPKDGSQPVDHKLSVQLRK